MTQTHKPSALQAKFRAAADAMNAALIERSEEIDLCLTAIVAGEHGLLVGQPGCGKSLVLDSLLGWLDGPTFSVLLHRTIPVDELMGQISVKALRERDVFERNVSGRLPSAVLAVLDEIWKASPVALSPLLRVLNERVYEVAGKFVPAPLHSALAGSNEWPKSEGDGIDVSALFDRFVYRKHVRPISSAAGRERLYDFDGVAADHKPALPSRVTPAELAAAKAEAAAVPFTDEAKDAFRRIADVELPKEGVNPGDRRRKKGVMACRAAAWLDGADAVRPEHLEVLQWVLWDDPAEQPEKVARVVARVANPVGMRVNQHLMEADAVLSGCDPHNLMQAAEASAKLKEIGRQLAALGAHPKAEKALAYVRGEAKRIGRITAEAMGV